METLLLSESAIALFRLHVERQGEVPVEDATREPYRELERAGLMLLSRPFAGPRVFRLTLKGFDRKAELIGREKARCLETTPD